MRTMVAFPEQVSTAKSVDQLKWQRIVLLIVLGYEAAGAVVGGLLLIAAPDGRLMEMPVEILNGAFRNFLIPGIILLGLGILNGVSFVSVKRRSSTDWLMAGLALGGFVIWFVVEIIILQELHWLHLMWGLPVLLGWLALIPLIALRNPSEETQKVLLTCGILSSLWYVAMNIFVPLQYDGYDIAVYTVSEMSAIGAPTRLLWVLLGVAYPLLFGAFGWGVLKFAENSRSLRIVGGLIIVYCIFILYWPPMHMRGIEPTLTDSLHIAWAVATNIFMWLFMGFGAAALDKPFRLYTIASLLLHVVFGILSFMEAPNVPTNGPTPTIGIWERVNILVFLMWVIVFALVLLRKRNVTSPAVGHNLS